MRAIAWSRSPTERYFGPFTWSPEDRKTERIFGVCLKSGGDEDTRNYLRISTPIATLLCLMPSWIIKPIKYRQEFTTLSPELLAQHKERTGRDHYYEVFPREFGFDFYKHDLHVHYGPQTHDSWTDRTKVYFYPWTRWRTVRHDYYDAEGNYFAHVMKWNHETFDKFKALEASVPVKKFAFRDYDGEVIVATLRLEETETLMGEGRWKWLSWFTSPKTWRTFNIHFSKEVGSEKGSWKGGLVGTSISSDDYGELHEDAFKRWIQERRIDTGRRALKLEFLHEVLP